MKNLTFRSQKVAYPYFAASVLLFFLQIVFGVISVAQYVWPHLAISWMPFNVSRSIHLNLLIFWMFAAIMGASYYIVVEEAGKELYSTKIAMIQLIIFLLAGVGAIISFFFHYYDGQGLEYVEAAPVFDWMIVITALLWIYNIMMTTHKAPKKSPINTLIIITTIATTLMYLPGMPFLKNFVVQDYLRWWVVHYWVEATWEMFDALFIGFLIIKLFNVPRERMYRWFYIEFFLILASGILGMGHHYFWIGTPHYWIWVGSLFSVFEAVPPVLMMIDGLIYARKSEIKVKNLPSLYWLIGGTIGSFIGLSIMGGGITWYSVNYWMHGTEITAAHGHMAFFGAFAATFIAFIYFSIEKLQGETKYISAVVNKQRWAWAFWLMFIGMVVMIIPMLIIGFNQVAISRMMAQGYVAAQIHSVPWFTVWFASGFIFFAGVFLYVLDFFAGMKGGKPFTMDEEGE